MRISRRTCAANLENITKRLRSILMPLPGNRKPIYAICFLIMLSASAFASPIQLTVSIATNAAGQPGSIIGAVPLSGFGTAASIQSGDFVSGPVLTAGTEYWAVVTTPDPVNDYFGWDRVSISKSAPLATNGQKVGSGAWLIDLDYEGTLQITGVNGIILFNDFGAGSTYDKTSGWAIGGGAATSTAGYTQALEFTPAVTGTAESLEIAAFDLASPTSPVPEPASVLVVGSSLLLMFFAFRRRGNCKKSD